jgi:cystathionine beta-lyase/cystathionine gamma-synthase
LSSPLRVRSGILAIAALTLVLLTEGESLLWPPTAPIGFGSRFELGDQVGPQWGIDADWSVHVGLAQRLAP